MSIALQSNNPSGFVHGMSCISFMGNVTKQDELLDSCSSSSIGRNSDLSNGSSSSSAGDEDTEVQSSYKGPLDTMDALEQVLPIRRGISKFYCGKSKSYTSLASASSSSSTIKDIAKPENAYSRKRRNLLASLNWDKNRNLCLRSNGGGISKRSTIKSSRSTIALAVAMSSSESLNTSEDSTSNSPSLSPTHCLLPPLHPQTKPSFNNLLPLSPIQRRNLSTWRSFSFADLQCADAATNGHQNKDHY